MELNIDIKNLPVIILKQGEYFVCYSPVLDFSSYGETFDLAKERFTEAVGILFEELVKKGNLIPELENLGWQVNEKTNEFIPPVMIENSTVPIKLNIDA